MSRHGRAHRRGVSLPETGASLNVREEECDSARGQLGENALPLDLASCHGT